MARDAALEASGAKSMFLANMSHEIRTPLTTVLATGEMLEDTPLDDVQLKLLAKMHRSGDLLKALVEGILDFSRIEAGQVELASAEFDLHTMVADAADVYVPQRDRSRHPVRVATWTHACPEWWSATPAGCSRSSRTSSTTP